MSMKHDGPPAELEIGGGESRVRQSDKDDCDMNKILDRYATTGLAPINQRTPVFADVSMLSDFKEALDKVKALEGRLKELPAPARELLREDPERFREIISDELTKDSLIELGVIEPEPEEKKEEPQAPKEEPGASGDPPKGGEAQ